MAMDVGHAEPLKRQDVSDKILDHIVDQLRPQPDGSHAVCVYSLIANVRSNVHSEHN